jgi:hypothetical protein
MLRRMKSLFALTMLTLSISPLAAQAEMIRVHGVELEARNVQYFVASDKIHSFEPVNPVVFPFARGNTFPSGEMVYLRENGSISLIASRALEKTEWDLGGRKISLDCGQKRNGFGDLVPRLVSFHENGEYKSGCALLAPASFSSAQGKVNVSGSLDLHSDLSLAYASTLNSGKAVISGKEANLLANTEIAFHSNGAPNFFTLAKGESFRSKQGSFGELLFVQSLSRPVSTTLFADGTVEKGIIGEDLPFAELGITVPALSGTGFTVENGQLRLWLAIFSANQMIPALGYPFVASRIGLSQENGKYEAVVAEPFTFKRPDGLLLDVPPGSIVTLSESREILAIRVPAKAETPFPRKQLSL